MGSINGVSIVIPVLNEVGNIDTIINRIRASFAHADYSYELVFIDDHSDDGTSELLLTHAQTDAQIKLFEKVGKRGKAYSILEGVEHSSFDVICMIDADLQYSPEYIVPMMAHMEETGSDIVITNRRRNATSIIRSVMTKTFHAVFTKFLFGLDYDTQSGLKVFKKRVLQTITISPSKWGFDLEFIVRSLLEGFVIATYDIDFGVRTSGSAKVNLITSSLELARESIKLRIKISGKALREKYLHSVHRTSIASEQGA